MLELKLRSIGEGTRILAKFSTAAEVEEANRKARIAAQKAMTKPKAEKAVQIIRPATGITSWNVTPGRITAVAESGKARGCAEEIRDRLKMNGWAISAEVTEAIAGSIALSKGEMTISIVYDDTGITPAELTISLIGARIAEPQPGK